MCREQRAMQKICSTANLFVSSETLANSIPPRTQHFKIILINESDDSNLASTRPLLASLEIYNEKE